MAPANAKNLYMMQFASLQQRIRIMSVVAQRGIGNPSPWIQRVGRNVTRYIVVGGDDRHGVNLHFDKKNGN
jgi:hypothetical protein